MVTTEQNTEQNTKAQLAARVDQQIYNAVERIASDDERTISNTVERLLKTSPQVQEMMEREAAEVNA